MKNGYLLQYFDWPIHSLEAQNIFEGQELHLFASLNVINTDVLVKTLLIQATMKREV